MAVPGQDYSALESVTIAGLSTLSRTIGQSRAGETIGRDSDSAIGQSPRGRGVGGGDPPRRVRLRVYPQGLTIGGEAGLLAESILAGPDYWLRVERL